MLQDSLGGNTGTYLISTVSPVVTSIEETISTLNFSDRAKQIMQRVKINEYSANDDQLVRKLQKEVLYLKEILKMKRKGDNLDVNNQMLQLKMENDKLRELAQGST